MRTHSLYSAACTAKRGFSEGRDLAPERSKIRGNGTGRAEMGEQLRDLPGGFPSH